MADLDDYLDNAVWHALGTRQASFAEVHGTARRFPFDVTPFGGVEHVDEQGWSDLAALAGPGGFALLFRPGVGEPPPGWEVLGGGHGNQMVLAGPLADAPEPAVRRLGPDDVEAMTELIALAQPGPFRPRTIELGEYWGVEEGGRLIAMAGERMKVPGRTEISAVATHPDARGRGLAGGLTHLVARRILERGETPFLHVAEGNDNALRVYLRLGFTVRVVVDAVALRAPGAAAPDGASSP